MYLRAITVHTYLYAQDVISGHAKCGNKTMTFTFSKWRTKVDAKTVKL